MDGEASTGNDVQDVRTGTTSTRGEDRLMPETTIKNIHHKNTIRLELDGEQVLVRWPCGDYFEFSRFELKKALQTLDDIASVMIHLPRIANYAKSDAIHHLMVRQGKYVYVFDRHHVNDITSGIIEFDFTDLPLEATFKYKKLKKALKKIGAW